MNAGASATYLFSSTSKPKAMLCKLCQICHDMSDVVTTSLSGFVIGLAMCELKLVSLKPLMPVALQCDSNKDLTRLSLRQSQSTSLADYTGAYSHLRAFKTASAGIIHRPPALLDTGAGICNVTVCQASGLNFSQPLRVKCGQGRMAHQPPALP